MRISKCFPSLSREIQKDLFHLKFPLKNCPIRQGEFKKRQGVLEKALDVMSFVSSFQTPGQSSIMQQRQR